MYENIADNLKYLRYLRTPPYSQRELAQKLHMSRATYGRYERGDMIPPIWFLEMIAEFYGIEMQMLLWNDMRRSGTTKNENVT